MSDQNGRIDLGSILELLTLCRKASNEAVEAVCVGHQIDAQVEHAKTSVVVAGSGVVGQIANGQARVFEPGHPNDPMVKEARRLNALVRDYVGNIIEIAEALKPMHKMMTGSV